MASFSALDPFKLSAIKLTTNRLGTGSYASVYEVNYLGLKCAGKKIHEVLLELEQSGEATYALTRFAEECRLLSRMRHPNIVQFLGVYFEKGMKVPLLIMEFLPTNLSSCIEHNGILRSEISYSILHDVSLGLNYLHSHSPPIIHRDLSSNNVLLAASMKAKISDLGVAKILNLTPLQVSRVVRNTETPGTGAYMPPEAMIASPTYNTSIDVFSYGVMVIHVFSGQWPEPQCAQIQMERGRMIPKSEAERRQKFLDMIGEKHPLMDLILRCIDNDPKRRPSANEVVPHLNDMVAENPAPFSTRLEMLQRIDAKSEELQLARQEITTVEAELQAIKDKQQAQPQQHVDAASQEEKMKITPTLSHSNGVDPRALDNDRLLQQAKEQSEEDYLKGALNTQVVDRAEQIRALNEIERAQMERRQKLLQNITDRDLVKMREQRSVQDEQLLGYHPSSAGGTPQLHQRSMLNALADAHKALSQPPISTQPPSQFDVDKQDHTYSNFPGGPQQTPLPRQQEWRDSDHAAAVAYASEEIRHQFTMGSTVELLSDPPRYGVIRWIGSIPNFQGRIAGVELEEPMEGCGDGMWNGVRYFSCRQGHGFFCPLASLRPDQRFAQHTVVNVNPLDYVVLEEEKDQPIFRGQIKKYIGEEKGIQGQQNSCYLDSTLFGLFAVNDAFDYLFLDQQRGNPAGDEVRHLLWKGIVNPLRKNGVVRHESVMRLRNKLEELGKMKGVNPDEKDPEEFLNMLFKHILHVPPFINIKRPCGVEQEYFMQLFVEPDDSLKLPTVEDLLARMFKEQKIRFTKVPSKLLIQLPHYRREFKTFKKTIPSLKLNLKGLLSSKRRCFNCGDCAWNECSECVSHFTSNTPEPSNVVYFCESCAKLAHGKTSGRDKHRITDVVSDPGKINELDLLSVICIETSHYICFTLSEYRWVFFDSMATIVNDMYNIPKVVDCTDALNEWVYPASGDLSRLMNTPPRELPEYVRRFTQDIYLCVYIQPDVGLYGDFGDEDFDLYS